MNTTTTTRANFCRVSIALAGITAAMTMAGAGAASAIPNIPDPRSGTTSTGAASWDGEANMAARHARETVRWWAKLA